MLADPQSITINAVANSFAGVSRGVNTSTYMTADGLRKLTISHAYGKRNRRVVRIDDKKIASDPLATGYNKEYSMSCYVVFDTPIPGYTATEAKYIIDGLLAWLTASSGANITKVLGGES